MSTTNQTENIIGSVIIASAGIITAAIGIIVIGGWILQIPLLTSFGSNLIPMAPSTAVLFILFGFAFSIRNRISPNSRLYWVIFITILIVAFISMIFFWLSWYGIFLQFEHLGLSISGYHVGIEVGHISPLTAGMFVVCTFAYLLTLTNSVERVKLAWVAMALAILISIISIFLLIEYILVSPFMSSEKIIPPSLPTTIAFLFLACGLFFNAVAQLFPYKHLLSLLTNRVSAILILIFIILSIGIITSSYFLNRNFQKSYRDKIEGQLSSISKMKIDQLVQYRRRRLGDGNVIFKNPAFSNLIRRFFTKPNESNVEALLHTWMSKYRTEYSYDRIILLDSNGNTRISYPIISAPIDASIVKDLPDILRSRKVSFYDFYRDSINKKIYLAILVPIISDIDSTRMIGLLVLSIDPITYLYPLISEWPEANSTSESIIVRREGNDVLFLTNLKFSKNSALNLRIPLNNKDVLAVKAVLGQEGNIEGLDYSGKRVFGVVHSVPHSPWFLVVRTDADEVNLPLQERFWVTGIFVLVLLISSGSGIGMIWRYQRLLFSRQLSTTNELIIEKEEQFKIVFEKSPIGKSITSLNGTITANKAFCTLLGYSMEEMIDISLNNITHPDDIEKSTKYIDSLLNGKRDSVFFEKRYVKKNGDILFAEVYTFLHRNENNIPKYFITAIIDITERKLAEVHLQESEVKYRFLFEKNPNPMWVYDLKTLSFLTVNDSAIAKYGYTREEFLKMTIKDIRPIDDISRLEDDIKGQRHTLQHAGEWRHQLKDGTIIYVEITSHLLKMGKNESALVVVHDITERKNTAEKGKYLEAQLLQVQKLESLGTLASGIAHDFNNILGIILGHSSLYQLIKTDPQKVEQSIEVITKATQRGASLVKQLLTFARKTDVTLTSVNINDIILEVRKLLLEIFPRTINISESLHKDLPNINADASQIHQVFLNLCVNARDAMSSNGTLSVSTSVVHGNTLHSRYTNVTAKQYVRVDVADTGVGMDEATRRRIFEPFFTTKDIGKGTGLGLSIVFGIVDYHNGIIDVHSMVGKGTTFTMYFPVPEHVPDSSETNVIHAIGIQGGTETILLIEDEEMLRDLVKTVLTTNGYTILIAEDGKRGVEMYRNHKNEIALVLSDMGLPLLSGQDVAKNIREINPAAKVVIASGFIDPEIKSVMLQTGIKNFIQKPYSPDEVLQKVREVLDTN